MLPLVTAAFTAYNAQETILAALESAWVQDWPSLEILIVDDASTDETVSCINRFISTHESSKRPVRLIQLPVNGGVASARNRLIEESRGEFIAFFDDDDVSRPDRITKQHNRLVVCEKESQSALVLCYAAREQVFCDGSRRYEGTMGADGVSLPQGRDVVDRIFLGRLSSGVVGSCATCSQMARKSVYERLGGFDPALARAEDTDFNIRAAFEGGVFVGLAEPLVVQTMTQGPEKGLLKDYEGYQALFSKYQTYLVQRGWSEFCARWQDVRLAWLQHRRKDFFVNLAALFFKQPIKLIRKIIWSLPAHQTQKAYRRWQWRA